MRFWSSIRSRIGLRGIIQKCFVTFVLIMVCISVVGWIRSWKSCTALFISSDNSCFLTTESRCGTLTFEFRRDINRDSIEVSSDNTEVIAVPAGIPPPPNFQKYRLFEKIWLFDGDVSVSHLVSSGPTSRYGSWSPVQLMDYSNHYFRAEAIRVHYWLVVLVFSMLGIVSVVPEVRRIYRIQLGHCVFCGYDLRDSPERCPECGKVKS